MTTTLATPNKPFRPERLVVAVTGSRLSALRVALRSAWATIVRTAAEDHGWRLDETAKALGRSHRTLQRWARELRLPILSTKKRAARRR